MNLHQIRALHDRDSITVYQAYRPEIADAALAGGRFVDPFSRTRMTWIKPSFLWMMERCGWATKPGQERVLAIRITRAGWEEALSHAVLTHPDRRVFRDSEEWRKRFATSLVRVQWDPERTIRGGKLEERSVQVGLGSRIVGRYVDEWTLSIEDRTPLAHKMHRLLKDGRTTEARQLLPRERPYPLPEELAHRIGADLP
ncbi:DUF4291 domain-containing protein [Actinomadura hibisca]|uniref:DUF4291 domain-containing protein n=1 Tax=Actinomadura hibisca TaxID=68565 RepID=UPI00082C1495|nr:DUF4291 domain-containing protein [Actinomadura hibisca]